MADRGAVIEDGKVTNLIVLPDDPSKRSALIDRGVVEVAEGVRVGVGWDVVDGDFVNPHPTPIDTGPSVEERLAKVEAVVGRAADGPDDEAVKRADLRGNGG